MLQKRPKYRASIAIAVLIMVVMPACFRPPGAGVSVKSLAADLVFGVPPLPEEVPPANFGVTPQDAPGVITTGRAPTRTAPPRSTGPNLSSSACAEAAPTDFPEQEATTDVAGRPKEGSYRWMIDGEQQIPAVGARSLPKQVARNVTGVRDATGGFEFKTVERELLFGSSTITTITWLVQQDGLFLTSFVRKSQREEAVFDAFPPMLFLPLPAKLGATVQSTSVSSDAETLRHFGTVAKRERVDACGKVIDSWFVDAQQTFTSATRESYERNYDYGVATQFGGILVFERVDFPPPPATTFYYSGRIGQVDPDPLRDP